MSFAGWGYSLKKGGRGFVETLGGTPLINSRASKVGVETTEADGVEKLLLLERLSDSVVRRGFGDLVSMNTVKVSSDS
jgi:hypothetical protein